ncbi:MAG: hypothetical protein SWY16_18135 [Cyanobacteriota bacterium]|nr:hypothetical protein [Cyanobacteriota bacterium]
MTYFSFRFPRPQDTFRLLLFASIGWGSFLTQPSLACSPVPGARPAPLEARVEAAPYVFEATVTNANDDILTLEVDRYFKGDGPTEVQIRGFNQTSCDDFIQASDDRYIFFGTGDIDGILSAVYDGAFGSTYKAAEDTIAELLELTAEPDSTMPDILDLGQFLSEPSQWLDRPVAMVGELQIEPTGCTRMACSFPPDAQVGDRMTCNSCLGTVSLSQGGDRIPLSGVGCSGMETLTYTGNNRFDTTIEWQSCQVDNRDNHRNREPRSKLKFLTQTSTPNNNPNHHKTCTLDRPDDFKAISIDPSF